MFKFLCGPPLSSVALRFDSAFPLGVMEEWRDAARTKTKAGYHWTHRAGTGQNFRNLRGQNFRKSHAVAASSVHAVQDGVLTNTAVGFLRFTVVDRLGLSGIFAVAASPFAGVQQVPTGTSDK